jgi:hypothetical protein
LLLSTFNGNDIDVFGNAVWTLNGAASLATIPNPFGTDGELLIPGGTSHNTAASATAPLTSALDIYTGDFTVECWIYPITTVGQGIVWDYGDFSNDGGLRLYLISGGQVYCQASFFNSWSDLQGAVLPAGQWAQIAIVRHGSVGTMYVNGVAQSDPAANWTTPGTVGPTIFLGASSNSGIQDTYFNGYISELRVSNIARYTANFIPPTVPFNPATSIPFSGVMQWPYLEMGAIGMQNQLIGVDLIGDGEVTIQIAYKQSDPTTFSDNPGFSTSLNVTPPYIVSAADTLDGNPIPIPVEAPSLSLILTWAPNQAWEWDAANFYLNKGRGRGF